MPTPPPLRAPCAAPHTPTDLSLHGERAAGSARPSGPPALRGPRMRPAAAVRVQGAQGAQLWTQPAGRGRWRRGGGSGRTDPALGALPPSPLQLCAPLASREGQGRALGRGPGEEAWGPGLRHLGLRFGVELGPAELLRSPGGLGGTARLPACEGLEKGVGAGTPRPTRFREAEQVWARPAMTFQDANRSRRGSQTDLAAPTSRPTVDPVGQTDTGRRLCARGPGRKVGDSGVAPSCSWWGQEKGEATAQELLTGSEPALVQMSGPLT